MEEDERICFSLSLFESFIRFVWTVAVCWYACGLAQSPIFSTLTSQAHGREIADKSVISCVAVLRVLHACGAANGINYDFPFCVYSQNVGFWPKHTQKNTYKHWKRERDRERGKIQTMWINGRNYEFSIEEIYKTVLFTQTMCRIAVRFIYICI